MRGKTAGAHVADVPERPQPLCGIERHLRELRFQFIAVISTRTAISLADKQFGFVHSRAQAFLEQAFHPFGVSRGKLFNALGKVHQLVGVERSFIIHHGVSGPRLSEQV